MEKEDGVAAEGENGYKMMKILKPKINFYSLLLLTALMLLKRFILLETSICDRTICFANLLLPHCFFSHRKENDENGKSFEIRLKKGEDWKCRCTNSHQNQSMSALCVARKGNFDLINILFTSMVRSWEVFEDFKDWRRRVSLFGAPNPW